MTQIEMLSIAKAGFPKHIQENLKLNELEFFETSEVFRLYDAKEGFNFILPKKTILSIYIDGDFVQFGTGNVKFDHYAAIKKMESLRLIGVPIIDRFIFNKIPKFLAKINPFK